jgi:Xaa-Pro aminopeptidase
MKRALFFALLFTTCAFALERQSNADYRARREALAKKAQTGLILVFANTEEAAGDAVNGFRQANDFYYLTGLTDPGAAVLIVPAINPSDPQYAQMPAEMRPEARVYSEVLFLPAHSPQERWTGKRNGPGDPGLAEKTGFELVLALGEVEEELVRLAPRGTMLWVNQGKLADAPVEWLRRVTQVFPRDVKPFIGQLRAIKDPAEVELIRKATNASMTAHRAAIKATKPGVNEHDIDSLMTYEFMKAGCERQAYAPIVGSGFNSTTLHYSADSAPVKDGDVVVMDVAGEYSMYASDITRTLPANGHFTARQREIYNIVLAGQQAAIDAFQVGKSTLAGNGPDSLVKIVRDYFNSHGADKQGKPLGQYFIHGLGHGVGLEVHDPLDVSKPLEKGMVFTIEPGIYIPEENLGVRIEDIFWVNPEGKLVRLTEGLPRTVEEVEKAMAENRR